MNYLSFGARARQVNNRRVYGALLTSVDQVDDDDDDDGDQNDNRDFNERYNSTIVNVERVCFLYLHDGAAVESDQREKEVCCFNSLFDGRWANLDFFFFLLFLLFDKRTYLFNSFTLRCCLTHNHQTNLSFSFSVDCIVLLDRRFFPFLH